MHVPGPVRAVQAHPLRPPPRARPLARRGLRVAAVAPPVPGGAARRRADVRRGGRRGGAPRAGEVPPAVVGEGRRQGRRAAAADDATTRPPRPARREARRRGLPGVPGGDVAAWGGGGGGDAADVRDVPELGARRVLRAVEAEPGRRAATCVVCRARWRQPSREQEKEPYINLSAYMNDAGGGDVDMVAADGDDGGLCAG